MPTPLPQWLGPAAIGFGGAVLLLLQLFFLRRFLTLRARQRQRQRLAEAAFSDTIFIADAPRPFSLREAPEKCASPFPADKLPAFRDANCTETCAVCLESLCGHLLSAGPCGHAFHRACLHKWVVRQQRKVAPSCPLCRQRFEEGEDDSNKMLSLQSINNNNVDDSEEGSVVSTVPLELDIQGLVALPLSDDDEHCN